VRAAAGLWYFRPALPKVDDLIAELGPDAVVAALDPLLTDERKRRIDAVLDARLEGITIVLENLYDPHNGAAAIRSAEAFGLADVHAIEATTPFDVSASVTIGAHQWLDLHRWRRPADCVAALRGQGVRLCATLPGATATLADVDVRDRWAIAFGNEHEGLSPELRAACDTAVAIPTVGFSQSLNLSVSVALVVSELAARRRAALGAPGDLPAERRARLRAKWYAQGIRGARQVVLRHVSK
jgi:tRNA (guanosine-2'-O-)-methyltransferase